MNSAVHGPPARSIVAAFATALLASACGADPGAAGGVRATRPDPVPSRPSAVGGAGAPHGVASAGGDGPGADEDRRAPTGGRRLDPGASARRGAGAPDPVGHRELPLQFSTQGTSKTPVVLPWTFREVVFVDAIRRPARAERLSGLPRSVRTGLAPARSKRHLGQRGWRARRPRRFAVELDVFARFHAAPGQEDRIGETGFEVLSVVSSCWAS
jgi:hypothetical protein